MLMMRNLELTDMRLWRVEGFCTLLTKSHNNKRNRWQVIQHNSTFSGLAGELERRTGHISILSIMCHPPTGINLLELTCPAFPLQLHLTASLHDYWASILAEYSTDIKDTWPLSHAKTLSALLHRSVREKTEKEGATRRRRNRRKI